MLVSRFNFFKKWAIFGKHWSSGICDKEKPVQHYDNTPIQYIVIFHGCKNGNFQMKNCDSFLIFAQNIDCGYTLEPPD